MMKRMIRNFSSSILKTKKPNFYFGKCARCGDNLIVGRNYPVWGTDDELVCINCFFEMSKNVKISMKGKQR